MMHAQPPLVTVVIPARNEVRAIARAVEAVAAQTYPADRTEVVVVDGNSTDDTSIAAKTALQSEAFARTDVLMNLTASTPSNLNMGLEWANGEILVRVDARSLIPNDYIERLVGVLDDSSVAVAGGSQVAVPRSDSRKDRAIARALNNRWGMGGSSYRRIGAESGPTDTVYLGVFRTEELRSIGGWNEDFSTNQDFELNRRMAERGVVWFEAGLPVGYYGRQTFRQILRQYHRFGSWKARYWRVTNDRPQPRQLTLVLAPAFVLLGVLALITRNPRLLRPLMGIALPAVLAVDAVGGKREADGLSVRALAGYVNALVGIGWWSGVVRGVISGLLGNDSDN